MSGKLVPLKSKDKHTGRISLETCKRVLKAEDNHYSDEEVLMIRDFIYSMASIDYNYFYPEMKTKSTVISLNNTDHDHQTESHTLYPGKHGRTG